MNNLFHQFRQFQQWKLFAVFLFVGLFASFALRAAGRDPIDSKARSEPDPPEQAREPEAESQGLLIDLGNENCPVMGGEADGETYGEWKHLRVAYCCPGCDGKFQDDPEGVLDKAGIEWREAARAVSEYLAAGDEHKKHKLAAIRKRWKIVREPGGGAQ